jgi:hypothetical protein
MREVVADNLHEITTPKPLQNSECLRQLADILKFMLSLFVHEGSNNQRLLASVVDSAALVYQMQGPRKVYLYTLLEEHGIWHGEAWRDIVEYSVQARVQDALRRKARKAAASGQAQIDTKSFFSKGFKQLKGMLVVQKDKNGVGDLDEGIYKQN